MSSPAEFDHLRVVLVATRNPLNIGAAARAMSNFGFFRLRIVNPYAVAFREARSAVGASPLLACAEEYKSVAEAIADCTMVVGTTAAGQRELHHPLVTPEQAAGVIRERLSSSPVALLFGSEKRGLSNNDLSHCHFLIRIPTREEHISMNLGQAVAICVYELARDTTTAHQEWKNHAATANEVERITMVLLETLRASGYVNPISDNSVEDKVRRLLHRLNLTDRDAATCLGMLRQILWKLASGAGSG
jgi:TrmH family RNA methyltransferase